MFVKRKKLQVIDGETLMDLRLEPTRFCVDTLLSQGVCMLSGAAKIGKSWMVLDWCVRIAKGEPVWNLPTHRGSVLYLALEDRMGRIQERLNSLTDEVPGNTYFAVAAERLDSGLCDQIRDFVEDHPDIVLVAVDIFQQIRTSREDSSYANDYEDIGQLKALADELGITVLLVHHNRKMRDSDPLNNPSGTTGISGALDTILVLDRSKREEDCATLYCTGRDVPTRQLELRMKSDTCAWELLSDSLEHPEKRLPIEMEKLVDFMKERGSYRGGNSEFTASFNAFAGTNFTAKALKQQICRNVVKVTGENIIVKELKTAAGDRYVYFSLEMANLLKEYRSFCQGELELHEGRELTIEDYIFRRHGADLPMTPSTFTWRFKLILKKHGLPLDLNVHSLRHTAASLMISGGADVATVSGILGHAQVSTTLDIYTHAFDEKKREVSAQMQGRVGV